MISSTRRSIGFQWQYLNGPFRDGSFTWDAFEDVSSRLLESALASKALQASITSSRGRYVVDFAAMTQTNIATGYQREVRRVHHSPKWVFLESIQPIVHAPKWVSFDRASSRILEDAFQANFPAPFSAKIKAESGDLYQVYMPEASTEMWQTNLSTGFKRPVKRLHVSVNTSEAKKLFVTAVEFDSGWSKTAVTTAKGEGGDGSRGTGDSREKEEKLLERGKEIFVAGLAPASKAAVRPVSIKKSPTTRELWEAKIAKAKADSIIDVGKKAKLEKEKLARREIAAKKAADRVAIARQLSAVNRPENKHFKKLIESQFIGLLDSPTRQHALDCFYSLGNGGVDFDVDRVLHVKPPDGWFRIGLAPKGCEGWAAAYHGTTLEKAKRILNSGLLLSSDHTGVYCVPEHIPLGIFPIS
jgi:hypothetical protein